MEKVVKKLDNMNKTLEKHLKRHNDIAQEMLNIMKKPENSFVKALTIAGVVVGILGIIQVVDTIIKWF